MTIPANTTDGVISETRHYCVPDAANQKGWQASLTCNGETLSAPFANSKTWQSGKNYMYVCSLSEKHPKLVQVVAQDMYFDCNDIVGGGEFSGDDMTE